jgi:hypothetical protein
MKGLCDDNASFLILSAELSFVLSLARASTKRASCSRDMVFAHSTPSASSDPVVRLGIAQEGAQLDHRCRQQCARRRSSARRLSGADRPAVFRA